MVDFWSNYSMTIDGKLLSSDNLIDVFNPATLELLAKVPNATKAHLDEAVSAASRAFRGWRSCPQAERSAYLTAFADAIEQHKDDFHRLLTCEQGKPRAGAEWEIGGAIIWCRAVAAMSLPPTIIEESAEHYVERRYAPLGVVGAITPWNFPILLAVWKIMPALVTGNTVVLKPSPYTPLCTLKLGEIARDILPPGVLNVVSGGDDLGPWLTSHPNVQKISFTGSSATGKKVMASASGSLKRITLELGGNDAAIVLPDVDPRLVAPLLFWASFQNNAQFCVACKRLFVHEDIYDALRDELVAYARTVKVGDGSRQDTELGPIQNRMQFDKVRNLIDEAVADGLDIAFTGEPVDLPGYFVPVTIFDNPPDESRVVQEEAFGPVLPMLKFRDIDDVIERANASPYGLAASVWSADIEMAHSIAERLETGTVWINEAHNFAPHIPFGGHKESGIGLENGPDGLLQYVNSQTIMLKRTLPLTAGENAGSADRPVEALS